MPINEYANQELAYSRHSHVYSHHSDHIIMPRFLFKTKEVKMTTLGNFLQQERQNRGLSIKDLSDQTRIKQVYLEMLEQSDFSKLPADVYVKGFLKNLAGYYNLLDQDLVNQFEKERISEPRVIKTEKNKDAGKFKITLNPKIIIITASIVLFLGALIYVGTQIRSVLVPPFLEITEPVDDSSILGNSVLIAGKTELGAEVTINNQLAVVDKEGQFAENLILSKGLNLIEVASKNKFGRISKILRKITAENEVSSPVLGSELINLVIQIGPNSAWIYLEADGVMVQRGTMLPGSSKTVSAKDNILLTSANAGSTQVIYNGKDLGKLGREGEVVRQVEFSASSN